MASKYKSPSEVELIAIYRLEFYKKQKNWKFSKDVCKKKAAEPILVRKQDKELKSANSTKSILNKTYNLDSEEVPPDLNDAFLEPDPDKIPQVTPPDPINPPSINYPHKSELNTTEQKWPEPEQQWPESPKHWPQSLKDWLEQHKNWPESQKELPEQHKQWPEVPEPQKELPEQIKPWPETQKDWPVQQDQWPPQTRWSEMVQQWPEQDKQWPEATRVWSVPEMPEQAWQNVGQWGGEEAYYPLAGGAPHECEGAGGWPEPGSEGTDTAFAELVPPEAVLGAAEDWLRGSQRWTPVEDARSLSADSFVSFMRGAADAPHSSELELNVTGSSGTLSGSAAACLSPRQLADGVSRHASALRLLLNEAGARAAITQHRPSTTDYRPPSPRHERPTRDVEPPSPSPPLLRDAFVAGSYRTEPVGRGRGRLHREKMIGIGMGRPYRL